MNKERSYIMFLFVVIVLCLLSIGGYRVFNNLISKNESNKIENNNSKINNELTEKEKEDISIKLSEILSFGRESTTDSSYLASALCYSFDGHKTLFENIEEAKTYIVLNSLNTNNKFKWISDEEYTKLKGDYSAADGTIEADIVIDRYKKIFGGNIQYKNMRGCPVYQYKADEKLFYRFTGCGGTGYSDNLIHISSIKKVGDSIITVELSIASINYEDDEKEYYKENNKYDKIYEKAKKHVNCKKRINNINQYLEENIEKENISKILSKMEEIMYES